MLGRRACCLPHALRCQAALSKVMPDLAEHYSQPRSLRFYLDRQLGSVSSLFSCWQPIATVSQGVAQSRLERGGPSVGLEHNSYVSRGLISAIGRSVLHLARHGRSDSAGNHHHDVRLQVYGAEADPGRRGNRLAGWCDERIFGVPASPLTAIFPYNFSLAQPPLERTSWQRFVVPSRST